VLFRSDLKQLKNVLIKTLNATCDKPFHPGYSTEQARLDSFKEWPTHMTQKPLELSKSGFYYYGIKDMVKCFFCNGGLRNWDPADEPLIEHARWFPKCPYIRQLKGQRFIEEVRERYKDQDSGFSDEFDDLPEYYQTAGEKKGKRDVSPRTVNSRMDMSSVRQLIELGIVKRTTIRQAIEKKLASDDKDFDNLMELTKTCMRMEANMMNLQKQLKSVVHVCISNLGDDVTDEVVKKYIHQNFGISVKDIKRFEEITDETRGLVMIQLNDEDLQRCDEIVESLNEKAFPGSVSANKLIAKSLIDSNFIKEKREETSRKETQKKTPVKIKAKSSNDEDNQSAIKASKEDIDQEFVMQDWERLKQERACVICLDRAKNIIFLPCAHLAACVECSVSLASCPICRAPVEATIRTFS